jgi:hypothetical protein
MIVAVKKLMLALTGAILGLLLLSRPSSGAEFDIFNLSIDMLLRVTV